MIERIYEDFEYLEHCVITDQPFQGLIIPPLPYQVAVGTFYFIYFKHLAFI